MNLNSLKLIKKYLWLARSSKDVADYIPPEYYDRLLKKYIFNGLTDLEHFKKYLKDNFASGTSNLKVLELGFGSGKATSIFFETIKKYAYLDLIDLSHDMHVFTKKRFANKKHLRFKEQDTIAYLENTRAEYDLVFSLWSFSHSVHQHMIFEDYAKASRRTEKAVKKLIKENMKKGGRIFIIHFDTQSDEQKILVNQWRKVFPIFKIDQQSPSKELLDRTFGVLKSKDIIDFKVTHYKGKVIEYKSINEALEIFMNFHMETYFNRNKNVDLIIKELIKEFSRYKKNGKVYISPGCFIYEIYKLDGSSQS